MVAKDSINSLSPAKINLGLSILEKLPNNYHEVKTIYCQISLFDNLTFLSRDNATISLESTSTNIPKNEKNLAIRAAKIIQKNRNVSKGVHIILEKNIPIESGLGGGSSNAAQTILAVNKLWELDLSLLEMVELAKEIGADVAYQLVGGVKLEYQGGENSGQFTMLPTLPPCHIVLCFPEISISSVSAYKEFDEFAANNSRQIVSLDALINALQKKSLDSIGKELYNDFEAPVFVKYPVLKNLKNLMIEYGAEGSLLSGKGSSVFGLFSNQEKAQKAYKKLSNKYPHTYLTTPYEQKKNN